MCRLLGYAAATPRTPAEVLGAARDSFTALSRRHGHGWGLAWYGDQDGLHLDKAAEPAWDSPRYDRLTRTGASGDALVAHLRWASMGLPVTDANAHPFTAPVAPGLAFAHNGSIEPIDEITELVAPDLRPMLVGDTDSERYFLAVLTALRDGRGPVDAFRTVTAQLRRRCEFTSLNALLLTPDALVAVADHDPAVSAAKDEVHAFHLRYRATPDAVVVASSGWPADDWTPLPNGRVLVVERHTLRIHLHDLRPGTRQARPLAAH